MQRKDWTDRNKDPARDDPGRDAPPAPTSTSIAIFAVVVVLLFGGAYLFLPDHYRSGPAVAQKPAPEAPVTTGQGGK
jgi:hypothetical protein